MDAMSETSPGRPAVGTGGVLLVAAGTLLAVLALSGLSWYSVDGGTDTAGTGFTFADLHADAAQLRVPVASAYFDWLAWALVVATALTGVLANLPVPGADVLRVTGFLLGFLGAAATIYALAQLFDAQHRAGGSDHHVFHNASLGVWAALAGFALAALGAVRGRPRAG